MRSYLLTSLVLFTCASFFTASTVHVKSNYSDAKLLYRNKIFVDFTVHRLSGERVFVSWHTEGEPEQVIYEVMRRHTRTEGYISLGVVSAKTKEGNTADYAFIDSNDFADSSYYCLKKTNVDGVIFYSMAKGVEGVARER